MVQPAWSRRFPARLLLAAGIAFPAGAVQAKDKPDAELGKQVFLEIAEPSCAICHTLADAGARGEIGPDFDELQPSEAQVKVTVTNGGDIMPAFGDSLSEEQIKAVAHYVATVAGRQ